MPPLRLRRSGGSGFDEEDILARRRKDAVGKELLSPRHQGTKGEKSGSKNLLAEAESRGHLASKASDVGKSFMPQSTHRTETGE